MAALPIHYPGKDESFRVHPLNRFPVMGELELLALAQDIQTHGQLMPVTLYDGMILDGKNRYLAIEKLNRTLKKPIRLIYGVFGEPSPEMDELAKDFLKSMNFYRRAVCMAQPPMISFEQLTLVEV